MEGNDDPDNAHGMMICLSETYMKAALTDEERTEIQQIFFERVVPRLRKLGARLGTISSEFAGPQYAKWMIRFRSRGDDFDIVDFEYDETGAGFDLDL